MLGSIVSCLASPTAGCKHPEIPKTDRMVLLWFQCSGLTPTRDGFTLVSVFWADSHTGWFYFGFSLRGWLPHMIVLLWFQCSGMTPTQDGSYASWAGIAWQRIHVVTALVCCTLIKRVFFPQNLRIAYSEGRRGWRIEWWKWRANAFPHRNCLQRTVVLAWLEFVSPAALNCAVFELCRSIWRKKVPICSIGCRFWYKQIPISSGSRGPWGPGPPCPQDFFKIMQFWDSYKEKTLFWANCGLRPLRSGPLTKILDPPLAIKRGWLHCLEDTLWLV